MTGALDSTFRPLAVDLARQFGKTVTLVRVTGSTFDPSTGQTTETTDETTFAAVPPQAFSFDRIDGSLVQSSDTLLGLPALSVPAAPTLEDKVKLDGHTWSIVQVQPTYSGELVALYQVQLRR